MSEQWVADELETVNFGDQRLNKRLINILQGFAARPNISIPAALGGRAELEAAYRFFDNDNVTPEKILKPHFEATQNRCKEQEVVLCAQDTSELDFTRPQQQVEGAGPLSSSSRHGAFLHLNETFTVNGVPLGAVGAKIWTRQQDENEVKLSPAEKRKLRRILPIEKKESFRWIEGIRDVQKLAEACPDTLCVSLSDSEGDIYELFVEPRKTDNFHWIVRACQDRALIEEDKTDMNGIDTIINENVTNTIRETIMQQPVLFTNEITVRGRQQLISCEKRSRRTTRIGRDAFVEVRAGEVTIQAPAQSKHAIRCVTVNVVIVREPNPPQGEHPIEWILLTTLPISTLEEVRCIIEYYATRWMIEVYFRTLKSGCRIEERRFETLARMLACTAVYMIVAWRTLFVCHMGRECPDMDCDAIFDASEWQSVWAVTHPDEALPDVAPKLPVMICLIASLGGYVNRPNRVDPPGVETLWKGLQRMRDLAWAWQTFGPKTVPK